MTFARANVAPVAAVERVTYHFDGLIQDDAGSNARAVIDDLRREMERAEAEAMAKINNAMQREAARHSQRWTASVMSSANIDIKGLLRDDDLVNFLSLKSEEFSGLVKNLSQDIIHRIERETIGSIFEGKGNRDIAKALQNIEGIGRNRATLIARDQASKLNGAMTEFRHEQAGITFYRWRAVLDDRTRDNHASKNQQIFRWDKPPTDTGHPGRSINCRCKAIAYIIEDPSDVEFEPIAGGAPWAVGSRDWGDTHQAVSFLYNNGAVRWSRDDVVVLQRRAQELLGRLKMAASTPQFTEAMAELLVRKLYILPDLAGTPGAILTSPRLSRTQIAELAGVKGAKSDSTRSLLIQAARKRLEGIEELARQSVATRIANPAGLPVTVEGGLLGESTAQATIAAAKLPNDGFAALAPSTMRAELRAAEALPPADVAALRLYSDYHNRIINRYMRTGEVVEIVGGKQVLTPASRVVQARAYLESLWRPVQAASYGHVLPENTVLYRGIGTKHVGAIKPGMAWTDKAFGSTSRSRQEAVRFHDAAGTDPVILVIYAGGKRGLSIESISKFGYEKEVLLPAGTTFRVRSIEKLSGGLFGKARTYVHVDIVEQIDMLTPVPVAAQPAAVVPSGATVTAGRNAPRTEAVAISESREIVVGRGKQTNHEWGVVVDENGREIVVWTSGRPDSLSLSAVKELDDAGARLVLHHNHPGNQAFSIADYAVFDGSPGLKRLYAHTHSGATFWVERASPISLGRMAKVADEASYRAFETRVAAKAIPDGLSYDLRSYVIAMAMERAGLVRIGITPDLVRADALRRHAAVVDEIVTEVATILRGAV